MWHTQWLWYAHNGFGAHIVTLVCTHRLKKKIRFGNWKKKIEGEGGRGGGDCGGGAKGEATTRKHPWKSNFSSLEIGNSDSALSLELSDTQEYLSSLPVIDSTSSNKNLVDEFPVLLSEALGRVEGFFFVVGGFVGIGVYGGYSDKSGIRVWCMRV